ncbi:MAG: hypothetical protein AB1483_13510 [Candidatus Zixiibacteriota bacterium]
MLASLFDMTEKKPQLKCYLAAFNSPRLDPFLESNGFSKGMICFSIPAYGILFRCRTEGELLDLEFGALFSLLEFVKTKLSDEKIGSVQILSSNPQLVFAFTENSTLMKPGSVRRKIVEEYAKKFKIAIGYVAPADNRALVSPAEYPSLPVDQNVKLSFDAEELRKIEFKPFQKGVKV